MTDVTQTGLGLEFGPLIEARGLTKVFDGVPVLLDADLTITAGEIHALVGANGSGKSTLIKILSGYHAPTAGQVITTPDPRTGAEPSLAFVHQDLGLVDTMSVLENVALSCGYTTGQMGRIRWKKMQHEAAALLEEFGLRVRSERTVGSLGGTERRLIAIARATHSLGDNRGVLVLDEPTAALPPDEVHQVFDVMKVVARRGSGVLFVSHNLSETLAVAQQVTVLRNGRIVASARSADTTVEDLAGYMFGAGGAQLGDSDHLHADRATRAVEAAIEEAPVILRLTGISCVRLRDIDLSVRAGEVVGVTGLVGCGKSELGRIIAGAQVTKSGSIEVNGGAHIRLRTPRQALDAGIAYVPPDRRRSGGVLPMDARENVTLSSLETFFKKGRLQKRSELRSVAKQMVEVGATPPNPRQAFAAFSGGNQQKLVFARVLRLEPKVVVLDDPTQGVDAETIPELYRFIRELAAKGCGVIVITADIDELVAVSDRVIVLTSGRQTDELQGDNVSMERVGLAVTRGRRGKVL